MRSLLMVACMLTTVLAGCVADDAPETPDPVQGDPNVYNGVDLTQFPERRFEGRVEFEVDGDDWEDYEVEKDAAPVFEIRVSDLHDYDFPLTFIDWYLFYDREPNPVAEGDAFALPGQYNRTLYAEGYHIFIAHAEDGQGFEDRKAIIVQVGEPDPSTYPNATQMEEFHAYIDEYLAIPEEEEPEPEPVDPFDGVVYDRYWKVLADEGCTGCYEEGAAQGCAGMQSGVNDLDCSWVIIRPTSAGHPFSVSAVTGDGAFPGAPDAEFLSECAPDADLVEAFVDSDPDADTVAGTIPEGAGCLVAFDLYSTSEGGPDGDAAHGGVLFEFSWTEDAAPYTGLDVTLVNYNSCYDNTDDVTNEVSDEYADTCDPSRGGCEGLDTFEVGNGCVWVELTPNTAGLSYLVTGAVDDGGEVGAGSSDPAGHFMSECSRDAEWVGPDFDSFISETGEIPPEAGCMMVYEFLGTPSVIRIRIDSA